jgi:citrate lyase beta subunit
MHLFPGSLTVSGASKVFDADGQMVDAGIAARAKTFIEGFAAFTAAVKR